MVYLLFVINVLLAFWICLYCLKGKDIVVICISCILAFWAEYIVFSGIFFWIDMYSIVGVLWAAFFINTFLGAIFFIKYKTVFRPDIKIKAYIVPVVIVLLSLPFTISKFEYFGMGQDEGVYQTQAIELIEEMNDLQKDFKEYYTLETEEEKAYFKTALETQLIGLYNYDPTLPFASEDQELSEVSAIYHGVPTFSSILALWGTMFGISHMAGVQTLFFICAIFFLYFCMNCLNIKLPVKIIVTLTFAFSPMVLWSSKSSLTEIELSCFVASFIFFLLEGDKKSIYFSLVPIAAFSFFHITIYTFIPVVICIYWICYIYTKRNEYIISSLAAISFFTIGITMIMMIAGTYAFINNFKPIYNILPIANSKNITYIIWGCSLFACIGTVIIKIIERLRIILNKILYNIRYALFFGSLILLVLYQVRVIFNNRELFHGFIGSITHSTMVGFALATGIILLISAGILSLFRGKIFLENRRNVLVAILFIYCICFYSGFMWKYVEYYYYYGRYLVPYIIVSLLFIAVVFQTMASRWIYITGLLSLLIILPYSMYLLEHKDDSRITWNIIYDLSEIISEEDAVVVNLDDMKFYYLGLRAMTDAYVYPADSDYVSQMEALQEKGFKQIYYISQQTDILDKNIIVVYENEYSASQDANLYHGKYIPFPKQFSYDKGHVICGKLSNRS